MSDKIQTREEAAKSCTYWACDEPERLTHGDPDGAIADYLENLVDDLPETITLTGYVRMPLSYGCVYGPLERLLESLDEEFADPDGDGTKPTAAMQAAEQTFVAAVLAEYKGHWCEDVYHEEINVREWCLENAPDLLEGDEKP